MTIKLYNHIDMQLFKIKIVNNIWGQGNLWGWGATKKKTTKK